MWILACVAAKTELLVRDRLHPFAFVPYTREKVRVKVFVPRTKANPNPRDTFKAEVRDVVRWPRYLFAREEALNDVLSDRNVLTIVRTSEGNPSRITDAAMDVLRSGCAADGRILKRSEILQYSVGDLLRFVEPSPFAGATGALASVKELDSTGELTLLVGAHRVRAPYNELAPLH